MQKQRGRKDKQSVCGTHTRGSSFARSSEEIPKLNTFGTTISCRASSGAAERPVVNPCFSLFVRCVEILHGEEAPGWNDEAVVAINKHTHITDHGLHNMFFIFGCVTVYLPDKVCVTNRLKKDGSSVVPTVAIMMLFIL